VRTELSTGVASGPIAGQLTLGHRRTDGFPVVRADQRGPIDEPAGSRSTAFGTHLIYTPGQAVTARLHVAALDESRHNGTPYADNAQRLLLSDVTLQYRPTARDVWDLTLWGRAQRFQSRFSAVGTKRRAERPAVDQFAVPANAGGWRAAWQHAWTDDLDAAAGFDGSLVEAETNEDARFDGSAFTVRRRASGQSLSNGLFARLAWQPLPTVTWTVGGRLDAWQRRRIVQRERVLRTGRVTTAAPPDEHFVIPSPALSVRWTLAPGLALRAAAGGGTRVPTLNELTRSFRVRQDVTLANPRLRPERSLGTELGGELALGRGLVSLAGYWQHLDDAIGNVTLAGPRRAARCPGLPSSGRCAVRRNLGGIESRGVELDASWAVGDVWDLRAGYVLQDARVVTGRTDDLDGRRSPQVPLHSATARLAYDDPRGPLAAVDVRYAGAQYDDDRNRHRLGGVVTVNAEVGWRWTPRYELFLAAENLFDRTVPTGRSDVTSVGAPRLLHGGLRVTF
jgi:vitamin B12 transporter